MHVLIYSVHHDIHHVVQHGVHHGVHEERKHLTPRHGGARPSARRRRFPFVAGDFAKDFENVFAELVAEVSSKSDTYVSYI